MTDAPGPEDARTYRASSGPFVLVVSVLFALFLLGDAVVRAGWGRMLLLAPWVLLALWIVYQLSVASSVRVDAEGTTVQNLLRRTSFGWRRVNDVDLRWQLEFSLDDGSRITAYGGPARSRPPRTRPGEPEAAKAPPGVRELTEIRDLWEAAPATADAPVRRTWDGSALIVLGAILLWAVASVLIAGA